MAALLTIEEAQARILERAQPLGAESVALADAAGRFSAEAALSTVDLPPFGASAMDGFAVRAADVPGTLPVVERIAAGRPATRALAAGEAMAVATGGAVPDGADAVVPLEYVVEYDNKIDIAEAVAPGAHVRPRGGDVARGAVVVEAGVRLGPAQLGALAAAGLAAVPCAQRPHVVVLTTGSELRAAGQPLGPGQIYDANGTLLASALAAAGAAVELLAPIEDDEPAHRAAIERGLAADVLVSSGGVSVGPHDLVRSTAAGLGVEEVFWGVSVKPGKPLAFGVRGRTLVFGLPGNPVSSLVSAELFVKPALRALQGARDPLPQYAAGRLASALRRNESRDELVRARIRSTPAGLELAPLAGQESHMIARAASADALVLVPRGAGELAAGTHVKYLPLG